MTINLAKLPLMIGVGAQTTYMFDNIVTPSESGINARKALRTNCIRNYMVSIGPDDADEFQNILLAHVGGRYPFAMRDWSAYIFTDELLTHDTTTAPLERTWAPSTGTRSVTQRILIPDISDVPLTVKVNGSPPTSGSWSVIDPGIIHFSPSIGAFDVVTASGQYLTPVCLLDNPTANIYRGPDAGSSKTLYAFPDIRLAEILEAELIELTS